MPLLGFWAFVVLFPLYWLAVTSLKLPIQVNDGPDYLPGIDFEPSLHAWRYIFVDLFVDTMRPYMNTVVVALSARWRRSSSAAWPPMRSRVCASGRGSVTILLCFGGMLLLMDAAMLARRLDVPAEKVDGQSVFVFAVLFVILAAAIAAGALFHRRLRRTVNNEDIAFWMISQRILPPVAVVLPIYVLFQQVGLLDTRLALIVTYVAANIPIVVWLMRDFFDSIPLELEEAALVDGCSRYRIFWSIVLPLSKPGLAATFILVLIMAWNEYLFALFLSSANAQTLPLTVAAQNATRGPQWWYMSVLIIIMIVPVSALALLLARYITRGLLIGAVKG